MPALIDLLLEGRQVPQHRPCVRIIASAEVWNFAAEQLATGHWTLMDLWGETGMAHMALLDEATRTMGVVSLECPDGRYPSVGRLHPPAIRLERAINDLWGLEAVGQPDARPWLDHGQWGIRHPLAASPQPAPPPAPYGFLAAEGPGLHQIAVGPVHAGIIEPGHFRFSASGETVVRLEERLGYVHKGIEGLMRGASLERGIQLASRVSGDSVVAYGWAFSRAVETALGLRAPPRADWLRALMAEIERLANHLGDIGAICNDAAFALLHAQCAVLREQVLRAADTAFGHRLMRGCILPGGVASDLTASGVTAIRNVIASIKQRFPGLIGVYDNTASLQDRTVATGVLTSQLARQYGAGGYVGRASGRGFDARRMPGAVPYDSLRFEVPVLREGDVNARVWIRIREAEQSLSLLSQILNQMPAGPLHIEITGAGEPREGLALIEGFRGDVLVWLRLDANGVLSHCRLRDPSWFQWPLLEAVVEGNIVADFPLCNKSFNCSYSGHDL